MFTLKVCFLRRLNQSTTYQRIRKKHYHIDSPQTRRCHAGNNNFYSWQTGDFPRKNHPSREEKCELSACKSDVSKVYNLNVRVYLFWVWTFICVLCPEQSPRSETTSHCLLRSISLCIHVLWLGFPTENIHWRLLAAECWHRVEFGDVTQRGGPHITLILQI